MGRPIRPPQPPATTRRSDHCYPEDAVNTTYLFPPYMNIDAKGDATPNESPRDRLIRESTAALYAAFTPSKHTPSFIGNGLELIRDHVNALYPPE